MNADDVVDARAVPDQGMHAAPLRTLEQAVDQAERLVGRNVRDIQKIGVSSKTLDRLERSRTNCGQTVRSCSMATGHRF